MNIYIDGSSPKEKYYPSSYCIFKEQKLIYIKVLEGNLPAQDVEYLALIETLNLIKKEVIKSKEIKIYSDCGYMIEELNYSRTPKNIKIFNKTKEVLREIKTKIKLCKISRYKNIAGKYLSNRLIKLYNEREIISHPIPNPKFRKLKYKYGKKT